jgi:hypothetical protein
MCMYVDAYKHICMYVDAYKHICMYIYICIYNMHRDGPAMIGDPDMVCIG